MAARFCIYTTDASPITDPDSATTMVELDDPPFAGEYDTEGDSSDRGSTHRTLGGIVVQDFGVVASDRSIKMSGSDSLLQDTRDAIEDLYLATDTEYYFSDGYDLWKVQFSRNPRGFKSWRNLKFSEAGRAYFSYEINLIVKEKY